MASPVSNVLVVLREALDLLTDPGESDDPNPCGIAPEPCRVGIYLGGEVPWDSCGEGSCSGKDGMLWAKLVSIDPVTGADQAGSCNTYMWTAEIGVVRCVASVTNSGTPPKMDIIESDAEQQAADADAIYSALACCASRPESLHNVSLTRWNPLGPSGGCAGGAWTVRGRLDVCC